MPRFTGKRPGESINHLNVENDADIGGDANVTGDVGGATATITTTMTAGTIVLGSDSIGAHAANGAVWGTAGTPALVGQQNYAKLTLNGTVYRIPLFANA